MRDERYILCPYCGHTQQRSDRCRSCGGLFEPLSRKATQIAMGPWFIRDKQSPHKPGCSDEVLKKMIASGRIKATTALRGPTTQQFWTLARRTPGIAHLLGFCYDCDATIPCDSMMCPECGVSFEFEVSRNELGLQYPTDREATEAQRTLTYQKSPPPEVSVKGSTTTSADTPTGRLPPAQIFSPTPTEPLTEAHRSATLPGVTWLLLGLNAVAAAVVGVLLWLNLTI